MRHQCAWAFLAGLALQGCSTLGRAYLEEETHTSFVGTYDGGSFETAMGMRVSKDGTFEWGLSVGALDMRAKGAWQVDGDEIVLQSVPVPVAPEFVVLGLRTLPDAPLVKVVQPDGQGFSWASLRLHCRDGKDSFHQIYREGWSAEIERRVKAGQNGQEVEPRDSCADPIALTVSQSNYEVRSDRLTLADLGWREGQTVMIEFRSNDLGVQDFTGMRGRLDSGILTFESRLGRLEMRKRPASAPAD